MAKPHRCLKTACRQRVSLSRWVDQYLRRPKCPGCGHDTLKPDRAVLRQRKQLVCFCGGFPFPHRRGSVSHKEKVPGCDFGKRIDWVWKRINDELGAIPLIPKGDEVPF